MDQMAILNPNKIDEFSLIHLLKSKLRYKKFTNTASEFEIDHCIELYLNIAMYEPLKGTSYIPFTKSLTNKKAIINVKNNDNECLKWALLSALYGSTYKKVVSVVSLIGNMHTTWIWKAL